MVVSTACVAEFAELAELAYSSSDSILSALASMGSVDAAGDLQNSAWHLLGSDPCDVTAYGQLEAPTLLSWPIWDSYFGEGIWDSNFLFDNANSQGFVARNDDSMVLSFRGTDPFLSLDGIPDREDWLDFQAHFARFELLVESISDYLEVHPEIETVYVTGHSLGAAMVHGFMSGAPADTLSRRFVGLTFASPGTDDDWIDTSDRTSNMHNAEDVIDWAALGGAYQQQVDWLLALGGLFGLATGSALLTTLAAFFAQQYSQNSSPPGAEILIHYGEIDATPDPHTDQHAMPLYVSAAKFIAAQAPDLSLTDFDNVIVGNSSKALDGESFSLGLLQGYFNQGRDADKLIGGASRDLLVGGLKADNMTGGAGDDTYIVDDKGDTIVEKSNEGSDTIRLIAGTALGTSYSLTAKAAYVENLILTGAGNFDLVGNALANEITGNDSANVIKGDTAAIDKVGGDRMAGGKGDDTYYVNHATDTVTEVAGIDGGTDKVVSSVTFMLGDDVENLELTGSGKIDGTGNALDNAIKGNSASNVIEGLAGADSLDGGAGIDTVSYVGSNAGVTIALAGKSETTGSGGHAAGDKLLNFENVVGSAYADTLTGDGGANMLDGRGGADTMTGGAGNDTYYVDTYEPFGAKDTIVELVNGGADTVYASTSYVMTAEVENGTMTGSFHGYLTGNASANILKGNSGHNYLNGRLGADTLDGGAGIDFASYSHSATAVTVKLGAPSANVGDEAKGDKYVSIEGILGSALTDVLIGDANENYLAGGKGGDTLNGGANYDTADYALAETGVTASLQDQSLNTEEAAGDVYISIERLRGSRFDDKLYGSASLSINNLWGGDGADELHGTASSFDYASYSWSPVGLTASLLNPLANSNEAAGDSYYSIDGLIGSYYDDKLYGDANSNWLVGRLGADLLDGGDGYDTAGYYLSTVGVTVDLLDATHNTDEALGDTFASIERIVGSGYRDRLIGDAQANNFRGDGGDDYIDGGDGNDVIEGGDGNDTLIGGAGSADWLFYTTSTAGVTVDLGKTAAQATVGAGTDTISGFERMQGSIYGDRLTGSSIGNILYGSRGNDTIDGKDGNDDISGDADNDTMTGGLGFDTFHFDKAHGAVGGFGADTIKDFKAGTDRINFYEGIFADFNQMFTATTDLGSSLKITSSFGSIILAGVADKSMLQSSDFSFY